VSITALQHGIKEMIAHMPMLDDFDPDVRYVLIREYWRAVKTAFKEEWAESKKYTLMRPAAVILLSIIGGTILEMCVRQEKVEVPRMAGYLAQMHSAIDWRADATGEKAFRGKSGFGPMRRLAAQIARDIVDDSGENKIRKLEEQLRHRL
jgi:hypothetical protein